MKELKIAILYPKYLSVNGDRGNIMMLRQRAEINNVEFKCTDINIGDKIKSASYDFYYIGGLPDEFNPIVTKEILKYKEIFKEIQADSKSILGVGFGYQILGNSYIVDDETCQVECLELLDFFSVRKNKRRTGNLTAKMTFMSPNYLVGFENHTGATYLNQGAIPLAYVDKGFGNNGSDKTEGAMSGNVIGTYLTGPVLPRNVYFADYLLKVTMETKYKDTFNLMDEENTLEEDVHFDFINAK